MADTLKIASKSPMPLHLNIFDGEGRVTKSIKINPAGVDAGYPEGVTEGVDADLYHQWLDANADHDYVTGGLIREIGEDEPVTEYGFEAGLAAAAKDMDNADLAEKGSTITEEGPVSSEDMAAHSDTPNTDLPTSDVNTGFEAPAQAAPAAAEPAAAVPVAPAAPDTAEPVDEAK